MKSTPFRAEPATRQRVSDLVFESLARAILNGSFKPDEPLTTQRDLAQQFNVSALVVRQAIHRLEDLGLVRVRQGSTTIVLDPNESSDIRLIQLQMELEAPGARLAYAVMENRLLFLLPMVVLAERRITAPQVAALRGLLDNMSDTAKPPEVLRFRTAFWLEIAKATGNPLFQQQVRWFAKLADRLAERGRETGASRGTFVLTHYRTLVDALAARRGAVALYLESIKPILDWADAREPEVRSR